MATPVIDTSDASAFGAAVTTRSTTLTIAANPNRVLYVYIKDQDQAGMTSVIWNTTEALTQIASGTFNAGTANWFLYRLINPSAGTANAVATFAGTTGGAIISVAVYAASQSTPNDAADAAEGSDTAATNGVVGAVGDLLLAFCGTEGTSTMAPADTETEISDEGGGAQLRAYTLAGAVSETFDITLGTSRPWSLVAININAGPDGSPWHAYAQQ